MISCLMVTQEGREKVIRTSVKSYARQSFRAKELVVVHDGSERFHTILEDLAGKFTNENIRVFQESPGQNLGVLRNKSVELAEYPYICQWDDDDLSHPERLSIQFAYLTECKADFCFMTDQLHLFTENAWLFWDDWSVEPYPGNLIQGTILGRKQYLGKYPDLARGEDTKLVYRLVEEGHSIAALSDHAWLYIYIYNGDNAWDKEHHKAISQWKRLRSKQLSKKLDVLNRELPRYELAMSTITLPHDTGKFEINPGNGGQQDCKLYPPPE